MPLEQKAIDELKEIYKRKYGEDLPNDEAWAMGNRLVRLFAILTRPPSNGAHNKSGDGNASP